MPVTLPELAERPTPTQIRQALTQVGHDLAGIHRVPRGERTDSHRDDAAALVGFIHDWDPVLQALDHGTEPQRGPSGPSAATGQLQNPGYRTLGQMVTDSDRYQQFRGHGRGASEVCEINLDGSLFAHNQDWQAQSVRALIDSDVTGSGDGGVFLPQAPVALPPRIRQMRFFLRDVMNVQTTTLSTIPYIREVNALALEGGASAVAEGSAKPEVEMDWELDDAPVRKVAAWVPVTSEIIDDAPTLMGYVNGRLTYLLAVREQQLVLNGSGVAPQIKGILQFADVQDQVFSVDAISTLGLAIGKVENVDGEANGIAMNPIKYWTMVTTRHAEQFDGDATGSNVSTPWGGPPGTAWGLPVVRTRALTLNQAVVADWQLGATLFDRQQTVIRLGNQHSDYFTNNKVAVLAEERIALAVHRPDFFVEATLA